MVLRLAPGLLRTRSGRPTWLESKAASRSSWIQTQAECIGSPFNSNCWKGGRHHEIWMRFGLFFLCSAICCINDQYFWCLIWSVTAGDLPGVTRLNGRLRVEGYIRCIDRKAGKFSGKGGCNLRSSQIWFPNMFQRPLKSLVHSLGWWSLEKYHQPSTIIIKHQPSTNYCCAILSLGWPTLHPPRPPRCASGVGRFSVSGGKVHLLGLLGSGGWCQGAAVGSGGVHITGPWNYQEMNCIQWQEGTRI